MSLAELSQIWKPQKHSQWIRKQIKKDQLAKGMILYPTQGEAKAWTILQEINRITPYYFKRQRIVYGYIIDFYCHPLRLGIEIDGSIHQNQRLYDQYREDNLKREGIKLLHFTNWQVFNQPEIVKKQIVEIMLKGET